jgi:hypothetical protein
MIPEANPNPKCPSRHKSFNRAPTILPAGPPLEYPMEYINLAMMSTSPMTADGMGKYIPDTNSMTSVEGAIYTKL